MYATAPISAVSPVEFIKFIFAFASNNFNIQSCIYSSVYPFFIFTGNLENIESLVSFLIPNLYSTLGDLKSFIDKALSSTNFSPVLKTT